MSHYYAALMERTILRSQHVLQSVRLLTRARTQQSGTKERDYKTRRTLDVEFQESFAKRNDAHWAGVFVQYECVEQMPCALFHPVLLP